MTSRHVLDFQLLKPASLASDEEQCNVCGAVVNEEQWLTDTCAGSTPVAASLTNVEAWPVLTCPVCHREHAHPVGVTAAYWPMCWECWEKETRG